MERGVRAAQLADLIRDVVAGWIHRDLPGSLLTVTGVTLTPDLRTATVWVSVLEGKAGDFGILKRKAREYTHLLGRHLQRRSAPMITFTEDTKQLDADRITELLRS